jgi:hypothetical protein
MRFDDLVERQIRKAIAEGKLSNLEGEGRPLPDRSGEVADVAMGVAVRIMVEAGALPEEFRIAKLLGAARRAWQAAEDPEEKRLAMAVIAELEQRHAIAVEARRRFMTP